MATNRPYLFISGIKYDFNNGELIIQPEISNSGNAPGYLNYELVRLLDKKTNDCIITVSDQQVNYTIFPDDKKMRNLIVIKDSAEINKITSTYDVYYKSSYSSLLNDSLYFFEYIFTINSESESFTMVSGSYN